MTLRQQWKLYRKTKRIAGLLREANVNKQLWQSRTFWFNVLTVAAEVTQVLTDTQVIPAGTLVIISGIINVGLRLVTDKSVANPLTGKVKGGDMGKAVGFFLAVMLSASSVFAQSNQATTKDYFAFDQVGAADIANYTYVFELDGALRQGPVEVACSAGAPGVFVCSTAVWALTPGTHVLRVQAVETVDGIPLASEFSEAFTFTFRAAPNAPGKPRIERKAVARLFGFVGFLASR